MPEKIAIPQRFIDAVTRGYTAFKEIMFLGGPGKPLPPMETANPEKAFRWPYPVGINTSTYNKQNELSSPAKPGVTFPVLRYIADSNELIRSIIDTCKDQIYKQGGGFKLVVKDDETPEEYRKRTANSRTIQSLKKFFSKPDGENTFQDWVRIILEEMLVLDQVAIYVIKNKAGAIIALDVIDGATIQPLVDYAGRRPKPPFPAYVQVIDGVPVADFTASELFVFKRNPRVHKLYGQSPVEQVLFYGNIGLRRMAMQLGFYTEGNIPIGLKEVPESWTPEQIETYQKYWDLLFSTNPVAKSRMWFVPGGGKDPVFPQKETLKDEFDEWLARVICHAFSVSPNSFIRSLNRASASESREQSDEEGMFSRMSYIKKIIDTLIFEVFGASDIEFSWILSRPQDSYKQAQIDTEYIKIGVKSIDEVRSELGLHPIGIGHAYFVNGGVIALCKESQKQFDQLITATQLILTDTKSENNPPAIDNKTKAEATKPGTGRTDVPGTR